jgi:uncharacterized protein (TIGR00297 family)
VFAFAGGPAFALLFLFFLLGSFATRLGYARKKALGIAQEEGGRRGARHALANTSAPLAFAFLAMATPSREGFLLAFVAAVATAACDTVSSEVGQAFGRRHLLLTTLRPVPAGTDGAVSLEGSLAGLLASAAVAAGAWWGGLVSLPGAAIAVAAAAVGTTFESYVGATFERARGIDNGVMNLANTIVGGVTAIVLLDLAR